MDNPTNVEIANKDKIDKYNEWEGYAITIARSYGQGLPDTEDIEQEARIALWKSICTWDERRQVPLKAWIVLIVKRRVMNYWKKSIRWENGTIPITEDIPYRERVYDRDITLLRDISLSLSPLEWACVQSKISGKTMRAVAREFGVNRSTATRAYRRAKALLKVLLKKRGYNASKTPPRIRLVRPKSSNLDGEWNQTER